MLIGCIGSHSTGKTSFVNAFVESDYGKEHGFHAVSSISRKVFAAGLELNEKADRLSQILTLFGRSVAEDDATAIFRNVITDRTPLDSLGYNEYQRRFVWGEESIDALYQEITEGLVKHRMDRYDKLLYFRPLIGLEDDGIRSLDVNYQSKVDMLIRNYMGKYAPHAITVPEGTVEERIEWFNAYL